MTSTTLRHTLHRLLGGWPEHRTPPTIVAREIEPRDGWILERLQLRFASGEEAAAIVTRPEGPGPHPAVLYCHAHGGRYEMGSDELVDGRPALIAPYGPDLARRGFVALSIDMPCFGTRRARTESFAAKALLWDGDTLFGQMLRELACGIDLLAARTDVDAGRIAALGLSMGATHAFWLAALDARIARVAHLCCFADLETLVRLGAHDRHGIYMMVPGLLPAASTGEIAGLVAPRPQLVCIGAEDALTPPAAVARGLADLRAAYGHRPEALKVLIEPGIGHAETPAMRAAVLRFLAAEPLAAPSSAE